MSPSEPFEPLAQTTLDHPYDIYRHLRLHHPVHWHEQLKAWVVSRHADCARILADHETFRSDYRVIGDEVPAEFLSLQSLDLPDHGVVRKALLAALRATDLDGWLADTVRWATKLLASRAGTEFDFVTEFAEPLAAHSMCVLFGIPLLDDPDAFQAAQRDLVLSMDSGLAPERIEDGMKARRYLSRLVEPWADAPPATGLLSRVDFGSVGGLRPQLINSLRAIFVAGYSSTSSALGNALKALLDNGLLAEQPVDVTPTAFHELVRFDGAVQAESRAVAADSVIGDEKIGRGDVVVVLVGAANRDETVFADPDRLRLDRSPNPHLGFGKGIHSCIGTRLALQLGTRILTDLGRDFHVTRAGAPVQRPTATLRGLDAMPVRLTPRHEAAPHPLTTIGSEKR